jgi:hypothetical protein
LLFHSVAVVRHIDAFQEVSRGQKVFDLLAEGTMEVAISVPETIIDHATLGLPSEVRFPTAADLILAGQVSRGQQTVISIQRAVIMISLMVRSCHTNTSRRPHSQAEALSSC